MFVLPHYSGICRLGSRAFTGFHSVLEFWKKAAAPAVILIPFFLANLNFKPLPENLCSLRSHLCLLCSGFCRGTWTSFPHRSPIRLPMMTSGGGTYKVSLVDSPVPQHTLHYQQYQAVTACATHHIFHLSRSVSVNRWS